MASVEDLFASLGVKVDKGSFERANATLQKLKTNVGSMGAGLKDKFKIGTAGLVKGLGIAVAANQLKNLAGDAIALGDKLVNLSDKVGISVESLQKLEAAAAGNGAGLEDIESGFKNLTNTLDSARSGSKVAKDSLKALGISLKDPDVAAGDLNSVFLRLSDGIAKVENPQKRLALGQNVLGRANEKLATTMAMGGAQIRKLGDDAQKSGRVLSGSSARALDDLGDKTAEASRQIKILIADSLAKLAPQIKIIVERLSAWLTNNREMISGNLVKFMRTLGGVLETVGTLFTYIADNSALAKVAILGLIYAVTGPLGLLLTSFQLVSEAIDKIRGFQEEDARTERVAQRDQINDVKLKARTDFKAGKITAEERDKRIQDANLQNAFLTQNGRVTKGFEAQSGMAKIGGDPTSELAKRFTPALRQDTELAAFAKSDAGKAVVSGATTVNTQITVTTAATDPNVVASKISEKHARELKATLGAQ